MTRPRSQETRHQAIKRAREVCEKAGNTEAARIIYDAVVDAAYAQYKVDEAAEIKREFPGGYCGY